MAERQKIGVLTGGGDCPGLNCAIRGVVLRAMEYDYELVGLRNGWAGLLNRDTVPLDYWTTEDILYQGGTAIGTSRTNPYKDDEGGELALENWDRLGLHALIAIGGDDTLGVAKKLHEAGGRVVGIPKTIDNDVNGTDDCLGFDTALGVTVDAVQRLRDTGRSHHRAMVLEVMGRDAGWIALWTGVAGGADSILIPEVAVDLDELCDHLKALREMGREYATVVVSEGVDLFPGAVDEDDVDEFGHVRLSLKDVGARLAEVIEERTGIETRSSSVGHIQRGGSPSVRDRVVGLRYGLKAVELINEDRFGYMPATRGGEFTVATLKEAVGTPKLVPAELYEAVRPVFRRPNRPRS